MYPFYYLELSSNKYLFSIELSIAIDIVGGHPNRRIVFFNTRVYGEK